MLQYSFHILTKHTEKMAALPPPGQEPGQEPVDDSEDEAGDSEAEGPVANLPKKFKQPRNKTGTSWYIALAKHFKGKLLVGDKQRVVREVLGEAYGMDHCHFHPLLTNLF